MNNINDSFCNIKSHYNYYEEMENFKHYFQKQIDEINAKISQLSQTNSTSLSEFNNFTGKDVTSNYQNVDFFLNKLIYFSLFLLLVFLIILLLLQTFLKMFLF